MAFIDLEKAFDQVPSEVVRWTLRSLDEWLVSVVAEEASRVRVRCASAKFRELTIVYSANIRGATLKVKGKVYRACI